MVSLAVKKKSIVWALIATLTLLFSSLFSYQAEASAQTSGQKVSSYAQKLKGTPFKYGGKTLKGFDASGYTKYVFEKSVNIKLPSTSADQYELGSNVKQNELQLGDLVFYKTNGKTISFVGIYIGKHQFIGATSKGVKVQSMKLKYWKDCYVGAKRIVK